MSDEIIDVSVVMLTYFHEKYVAKAIESVLSQKTNYNYEIVIADDCSTDGTRNILREYEIRYPNIIHVIYNDKNLGITKNKYNACSKCRGRYIADLAGDDYWIDTHKIDLQVSFLDEHPQFSAVTTKVEARIDDDEDAYATYPNNNLIDKYITLNQYLHDVDNVFPTNGIFMRNYYLTETGRKEFEIMTKASRSIDDSTECILMLLKGPVYILGQSTSVYRVPRNKTGRKNYNSTGTTMGRVRNKIELYNYLSEHLIPHLDYYQVYINTLAIGFLECIRNYKALDEYKEVYSLVPMEYRKRSLRMSIVLKSIKVGTNMLLQRIKR